VGNAVKTLLAAAVAAVALPVSAGNATPAAATTVSCQQVWGSFNIQLIGDREWGWNLGALGTVGAPTHKSIIVVWSLGGFAAQQGLNIYGWATGTRSRMADRCKRVAVTPKQPSLKGLGPVTRVKDGWAFGRKFGCLEKGPLLITTTQKAGKTQVVVRIQKSGKVMAVGELAGGGGWIRGSKTCEAKEK
jgi:hypothetical protein